MCSLPRFHLLSLLSLGICLALSAGCSSDSRPDGPAGPVAATVNFPPVMSGTETFAEGTLLVQVALGMPTAYHQGDDRGHAGDGSPRGGRRGGGGHRGGGMHSGAPGGPDGEVSAGESSGEPNSRPTMTGSNLPPAQLKLHLQNTSTTGVMICEVTDFNSALGNFAVFPSRYTIEPGQSTESEIMTSRLGVEAGELPVTVAIRIHDHVEKKVITLHLLPKPEKAPDGASQK